MLKDDAKLVLAIKTEEETLTTSPGRIGLVNAAPTRRDQRQQHESTDCGRGWGGNPRTVVMMASGGGANSPR